VTLTQENLHLHDLRCNNAASADLRDLRITPESKGGSSRLLLKAALLGDSGGCISVKSSERKSESAVERDINSNLETKCLSNSSLSAVYGNEADSYWRMSGNNGYERNRMTGSSPGSGNNQSLGVLADGSTTQGQVPPHHISNVEGMLLGRVGAGNELSTRSIVAGTAGAGPQSQIGSVFRSPQSVVGSESQRYAQGYTTAGAGSSAVGPFSPLYSVSHSGPFSAFYSQYPGGYNTGTLHGTLEPQIGTYSAVLQSIGNAAQSQVPRSPYAASGSGLIGQFPLPSSAPVGKSYSGASLSSTHEGEDLRYKRDQVSEMHRRYSTSVLSDEKSHQFAAPNFAEPSRASLSTLRESPVQKRDHASSGEFYKTPTGRGGLKQRILRPSDSRSYPVENPHSAFKSEEPVPKKAKTNDSSEMDKEPERQMPSDSGLKYPTHFMKGSIIQLGNGELKRVEDLETDDFIHSADVSNDLRIDSSTVVQISENETQGTSVLGFVVGEHKVQVRSFYFVLTHL